MAQSWVLGVQKTMEEVIMLCTGMRMRAIGYWNDNFLLRFIEVVATCRPRQSRPSGSLCGAIVL